MRTSTQTVIGLIIGALDPPRFAATRVAATYSCQEAYTMRTKTINKHSPIINNNTADPADLDPKQTVWFQIDDATGFYVTVEEFLAVARSQMAVA